MSRPTLVVKFLDSATPIADKDVCRLVSEVHQTMLSSGKNAAITTSNSIVFELIRSQVRSGYISISGTDAISVEFHFGAEIRSVDKYGNMLPSDPPVMTLAWLVAMHLKNTAHCDKKTTEWIEVNNRGATL